MRPLYPDSKRKLGVTVQKSKAYESYLVGLARLEDKAAFSKLVAYRGPRLFAHAYRLLGHREEANDAVQEAWAEIIKGLPKLREDSAFPTWTYRIVSRRCARQIKQNMRNRQILQTEMNPPEASHEEASNVREAIERLSPNHAATIRLFYIEEFTLREVSLAMDVPEGTVKSRLAYAFNKLKSHLKGHENA